jgi:stearoyl-CoA desaturase (delta-9 desaturase)
MAETVSNSPKLHISEQPFTLSNWHRHVNWVNTTLILIVPFFGCVAAFYTQLRLLTAIWAFVYYFWTGLGITAGYHRLWAHRSYEA